VSAPVGPRQVRGTTPYHIGRGWGRAQRQRS
jgi:hypothetical protein